jgi:hypothetical protein
MTKRRVGVSIGNRFEGSQVSKSRPGAPFNSTIDIAEGTCNGSIESGCWTEAFFITFGGHRPMTSPVEMTNLLQENDLSTQGR